MKKNIFLLLTITMFLCLVACSKNGNAISKKAPANATELNMKNVGNYLKASATFNKAGTTSQSDLAVVKVAGNGSNIFYDTVVQVRVTGKGSGQDDNIVNITLDELGNGSANVSLSPKIYASTGGCKIMNIKGKVVENDPFK